MAQATKKVEATKKPAEKAPKMVDAVIMYKTKSITDRRKSAFLAMKAKLAVQAPKLMALAAKEVFESSMGREDSDSFEGVTFESELLLDGAGAKPEKVLHWFPHWEVTEIEEEQAWLESLVS